MMANAFESLTYPIRLKNIIGRIPENRLVDAAIRDKGPKAIYFYGEGGVGKTRLLEDVIEKHSCEKGIRMSSIIDLYHPDFHDYNNVQLEIAQSIDKETRFFQLYKQRHEEYKFAQQVGGESKSLARLAEKRDWQFLKDYQALAERVERIILLFDTTELIEYDHDVIQELCQIDSQMLAIINWLSSQAAQLNNTVILLAGRRQTRVEADLEKSFQAWNFERCELKNFSPEETEKYVFQVLSQNPKAPRLTKENYGEIYRRTGGRPIRLALLLLFLMEQSSFDKVLLKLRSYDRVGASPEGSLESYIIERLQDFPDPSDNVMKFLFLARKGMDRELLMCLLGGTDVEAERIIEELKKIIYIKTRFNNLYLHDDLYDLFDRSNKDFTRLSRDFRTLVEYYRDLEAKASTFRLKLEAHIPRLYYELQFSPEMGCNLYEEWASEAIYLHLNDTDMRLRDEMLRFMHRYESENLSERIAGQLEVDKIIRAEAVHWVERHAALGQYVKACEVAESIRTCTDPSLCWEKVDDPLYKSRLLLAWAEAEHYRTKGENSDDKLDQALDILQNFNPQPGSESLVLDEAGWKSRILGLIYNRKGYISRVNGIYSEAIPLYKMANKELMDSRHSYLRAQVLTNLAFLISQTGDPIAANTHIQDALEIWNNMQMNYREALTRTAFSLILCDQDLPMAAMGEVEYAKKIFEEHKEDRGLVMSMIAMGLVYRKLGNMWKKHLSSHTREGASNDLNSGEQILLSAYEKAVTMQEPLLKWEALNELGSLYCDWAWLSRAEMNESDALKYYNHSINHQIHALAICEEAKMKFQIADTLDDLAQAYGDRCFLHLENNRGKGFEEDHDKAYGYLRRVEEEVPASFQKFDQDPSLSESGEPYWLIMGKINLWRGIWSFRLLEQEHKMDLEKYQGSIEKATRFLLTAQAYFTRYGINSPALERSLG
ncbi:MAG: hypothetical protein GYA36_21110, partial [Veillonellaceae bacterium]|nr:hypothetical protein [Veillonellaceae bacterium]